MQTIECQPVYHSQLTEFPSGPGWDHIKRRTCGITSAAMAISIHHPEVNPMDVLVRASELHRVPASKTNYWLEVSNNGQKIYIPYGQTPPAEPIPQTSLISDPPASNPSDVYSPVFSIANGYDHRGSSELFASFGMEARKVGDHKSPLPPEDIRRELDTGHVLLLSIKNSLAPWLSKYNFSGPLTHVVVVDRIENINGQDCYHLLDPYSQTGTRIEQYRPVAEFHQREFSGFGTSVAIQ